MEFQRRKLRVIVFGLLSALTALAAGLFPLGTASAMQLNTRGITLSSPMAGATGVTYEADLAGFSVGLVGAIRLQFCSNDPFPGTPCTVPNGFDTTAATLTAQTGMVGFSLQHTAANELTITKTPGPSLSSLSTYTFSNVQNASDQGPVYVRVETYATASTTSTPVDSGGIALDMQPGGLQLQTYVPPYITFCVGATIEPYDCSTATGNYQDFGEFSSTRTATTTTKLLISTNAEFGYTITVQGTSLYSGINEIAALGTPDVSRKGVAQFGMNVRANTNPTVGADAVGPGTGTATATYNTPNMFAFKSGDVIISSLHPEDRHMFTLSFIANVPTNQAPGVYVTTLTYIALGSF